MPTATDRALPWVFLAGALAISVAILAWTSDEQACSKIPSAYSLGVQTERSDTLDVIANHCEVTGPQGTVEKTVVNWSGIAIAVFLSISAWFLGALIGGLVNSRLARLVLGSSALVIGIALVAFFA